MPKFNRFCISPWPHYLWSLKVIQQKVLFVFQEDLDSLQLQLYSHSILNVNSDYILQYFIFLTAISCDGSNQLWCQCLLLPAAFPMTSLTQAFDDTKQPQVTEIAKEFTESWNVIVYINISVSLHNLLYDFAWAEWLYRTETVFILMAI